MKKITALSCLLSVTSLLTAGCHHSPRSTGKELNHQYQVVKASSRSGSVIAGIDQSCSDFVEGKAVVTRSLSMATVLTPLIAFGADFAVKYIGKKIEERKADLSGQFLSTGKLNSLGSDRCVVVVRGNLQEPIKAKLGEHIKNAPYSNHEEKWLKDNGWLIYPEFYLLMQPNVEDDIASLMPYKLNYGNTSAKRAGKNKKNVSLALAMSFDSLLSEEEIGATDAKITFRHNFGELEIGHSYDKHQLTGTAAYSKLNTTDGPFLATGLVTESEEPSIALQAMSEAFESKKGDLQKSLESILAKIAGIDKKKEGEK